MKNEKKQKQLEKLIKEGQRDERESLIWFQSGRTVRSVDFQRIENNPNDGMPLTPYELEVKSKLASAPSPYEELARVEEEEELEKEEHARKTKLGLLVQRTMFSPQQRLCYELYYERQLPVKEVRKRMGISLSHFCHLKKQITTELKKALRQSEFSEYQKKMKHTRPLTLKQKIALRMNRRGHTFEEIGAQLGVSKQTAHEIYERGLKKISRGK